MRYQANKSLFRRSISAFRDFLMLIRVTIYSKVFGMHLSPSCRFSLRTKLDLTNPKGVNIGDESYLAFGVVVFTHDMSRAFHADTHIGSQCFIGANSIIMPGIKIGNNCVIGAGSVVTKDVPDNSIAAGNPARVIKSGIKTRKFGIIVEDEA